VLRWAGLEYIDDCSALMDYFFRQQDNVRSRGDYCCLDDSIQAQDGSSSEAYNNDHLWQPLARLIERLPGLVDYLNESRGRAQWKARLSPPPISNSLRDGKLAVETVPNAPSTHSYPQAL